MINPGKEKHKCEVSRAEESFASSRNSKETNTDSEKMRSKQVPDNLRLLKASYRFGILLRVTPIYRMEVSYSDSTLTMVPLASVKMYEGRKTSGVCG